MRLACLLLLVLSCGGPPPPQSFLDGIGEECVTHDDCTPGLACEKQYFGTSRCSFIRENGESCPDATIAVAWGWQFSNGTTDSHFACARKCRATPDCRYGMECWDGTGACWPPRPKSATH